jgi:hypothetical protein
VIATGSLLTASRSRFKLSINQSVKFEEISPLKIRELSVNLGRNVKKTGAVIYPRTPFGQPVH